jgi:hypothetical protein
MSVNSTRSERIGLLEGATDGKYRKARPNTEVVPGMGNEVMQRDRGQLHAPMNYGFITQEIPLDQRAVPGC